MASWALIEPPLQRHLQILEDGTKALLREALSVGVVKSSSQTSPLRLLKRHSTLCLSGSITTSRTSSHTTAEPTALAVAAAWEGAFDDAMDEWMQEQVYIEADEASPPPRRRWLRPRMLLLSFPARLTWLKPLSCSFLPSRMTIRLSFETLFAACLGAFRSSPSLPYPLSNSCFSSVGHKAMEEWQNS
ncbi:hypothetical protein PFICI_01379 [Pestalotiopsis fici W106-1]|uniref:Uncharacterized protein n=1 Tax=Pestalotiopsis fici (strain W106-1 / CGMCC3.15140) TaxID=1229662 RepID=W3XQL1_PESFW|nr:uncharacterized protein PFICI_01379 [Pestalotiopsis fici W106-1]ETS87551.1 hypothetical protein PFICI_01379 [Pestalotiopsis fici W106-1]